MVQTRSKYRLLKNNPTAAVTEESAQPSSSTSELSSASSSTNYKRKKYKKKDDCQALQSPLSSSSDLLPAQPPAPSRVIASAPSLKAADHRPHSSEEDISTPFLAPLHQDFYSSESDDDTFDNNLHIEQKTLIDAYNREDDEQDSYQLNYKNNDTIKLQHTLLEQPNSSPIEKDDLQWTKTKRGKDCLIIGNFSYIYMSKSEKKNLLNFRCQRRDRNCRAVVHLCLSTRSFIDTNNINHNHHPDKFMIKQKILNHKIDERVAAEPTSILKIIEHVYAQANLTDEEQLNIRLPKAVASTYYKKRSRRYPAHPKTQDFDIPEFYSQNNRGEEFIIYDVTKERLGGRLLMFSTPKLLAALFNSDIILCDGTFKTRPLLFQQVYVLMGKYHGETIPLVWCLSSSRTESTYDAILKKLKKIAKQMNMQWKVKKFMTDFERAIINAFHNVFPDVDLKCCWYHYTQALWRKVQKLGLSTAYETDPLINSWFKQFMALPLISIELIDDALQLLKNNIPSTDHKYYRFIKYFEREYMTRTAVDLWYHGCSDMKTNNSLEGYNFRLLNRFGLHPSIWEFIHYLKHEEALVSHRITHLGGGGGITSSTLVYVHMQTKSKAKENQKQLIRLQDLYYSNIIGLKQYLTSVSLIVGKAAGQCTNVNGLDQADEDARSVKNEDIVD